MTLIPCIQEFRYTEKMSKISLRVSQKHQFVILHPG
jgi:hypothetical protein